MQFKNWKKPFFVHPSFIAQFNGRKSSDSIVAFNRSTVITQEMLGVQCEIYNGIKFYSVLIEADMLGHCLGEFSPTRKKPIPKKKKFK